MINTAMEEEKKNDGKKPLFDRKNIKYIGIICVTSLLMASVILLVQNHTLRDRLVDQETINEGLRSENQELHEEIDEYSLRSAEADNDHQMEVQSLQNELNKADGTIASLREEIDSLMEKQNDKEELLGDLEKANQKLEESEANNEKLHGIYRELVSFMNAEYLGSELFNSNQYIIFTDGNEKEITVTAKSSREYTTTVTGNNNNISTEWKGPFVNYQAELKFIPQSEGVTQFTFTNSFNSDSFKVIVVYLKQ